MSSSNSAITREPSCKGQSFELTPVLPFSLQLLRLKVVCSGTRSTETSVPVLMALASTWGERH